MVLAFLGSQLRTKPDTFNCQRDAQIVSVDVSDVSEVEIQVHNDYISCAELGIIVYMYVIKCLSLIHKHKHPIV